MLQLSFACISLFSLCLQPFGGTAPCLSWGRHRRKQMQQGYMECQAHIAYLIGSYPVLRSAV